MFLQYFVQPEGKIFLLVHSRNWQRQRNAWHGANEEVELKGAITFGAKCLNVNRLCKDSLAAICLLYDERIDYLRLWMPTKSQLHPECVIQLSLGWHVSHRVCMVSENWIYFLIFRLFSDFFYKTVKIVSDNQLEVRTFSQVNCKSQVELMAVTVGLSRPQ